jgi:P-type Ca2+ transporter type 2C
MATDTRLDPAETARAWHAASPAEAAEALKSDGERGLERQDVQERRDAFGPNRLPRRRRKGPIAIFLRQFQDPLIYILLVAAAVSLAIGNLADAGFIFAVLLFNAGLGTYQEYRAESAAEALNEMMTITARVTRAGKTEDIDSEDLVPGDLVSLQSGAAVPADVRLLKSETLQADESLLTGESSPVEKSAQADLKEDTPLGDRVTLMHAGSTVLSGRGTGIVVRTGRRTEIGRIAESLSEAAQVPPLVLRMRRFTRVIAVAILGVVAVLGVIQFLRGAGLEDIFLLSVALAVSAVPAGLPVAVTVALATGSSRMAARNVIVRRLPAVEGLGACTLIASDKTGTLTENELTASRIRPVDGNGDVAVTGTGLDPEGTLKRDDRTIDLEAEGWLRDLAIAGTLCNEAELRRADGELQAVGDTVDAAFLVFAAKLDLSRSALLEDHPEVARIPFESERRFAVSFNRHGDQVIAHVKGAAEAVVKMCGGVDADAVAEQEARLADDGYRVLAVAAGAVDEATATNKDADAVKGLTFLGLVGLIDPLRAEVPEAIERCRAAGVEARMITGDHPRTALAIARKLTIADADEDVVVGRDLPDSEEDLDEAGIETIRRAQVYARVEPRQKTVIVDALQQAGHFVAVTGDGVNDAPALRAAHIGVAMGKDGTDVARGAAELILTDDNFASIVNGIEEGRVAYDNVRKVVWLLISTGLAEIVLFALSVAFDTPLPLTPVQLLWLNLVTNGIQDVALAFEKQESGVLDRPPRPPQEGIFNRVMVEEVATSGLYMGLVAFTCFFVLTERWGYETAEARNLLLLLLVLFENVHAFNVRSETRSAFRIPLSNNWLLVLAVVAAQGVHIASMYVPGWRDLLGLIPVTFATWATLLAITLSKFFVVEVYKHLRGRRLAERLLHERRRAFSSA